MEKPKPSRIIRHEQVDVLCALIHYVESSPFCSNIAYPFKLYFT
jgi:hypothetical protein